MNRRRFIIDSGVALFLPAALPRLDLNAEVHSSGSHQSYAAEMPDMLESYLARKLNRALTQVDRYLYGADIFVPEILQHLDLPQVAAAVSPRQLTLIEPRNAMKETVSAPVAEAEYRWTRDIYKRMGANSKFRTDCNQAVGNTGDRYIRLLEASRRLLGPAEGAEIH